MPSSWRAVRIATARAWSYRSDQFAEAQVQAEELDGQVVVKYDGLAAGKGVYVCSSVEEANEALTELQDQHPEWFSFLLEEKLSGPEISIIGITDGNRIRLLAPSQDHKQLLAGDQGGGVAGGLVDGLEVIGGGAGRGDRSAR